MYVVRFDKLHIYFVAESNLTLFFRMIILLLSLAYSLSVWFADGCGTCIISFTAFIHIKRDPYENGMVCMLNLVCINNEQCIYK